MIKPLVTVCITTYNRAGLIKRTVDSIINQTYNNLEILIVDDCSSDNTENYIREFIVPLDKRIKYIKHKKNKGLASARNTALNTCSGKYFTWCDDDDELLTNSIEERLRCFEARNNTYKDLVVVYTSCSIIDNQLNRVTFQNPEIQGLIEDNVKEGRLSTIPSSGLYSVFLLKKIKGFDVDLKSFVDHDFWLKLSKNKFSAIGIEDPLTKTYYYRSKKSMVTDVSTRISVIEQFINKWSWYFKKIKGKNNTLTFLGNYRLRVIY